MMVVEGPAGNGIGKGVAERLAAQHVHAEHKLFPDGESYIRMPKLPEDDTVIVVQSTYAPSEKHLMELLFMIDALKENDTERIVAIVPYLAYARQNKIFREGEAASIGTVMNIIGRSGAEALITVEPHRRDVMSLFGGKHGVVEPSSAFAAVLAKETKAPFVVATDSGDMERAGKLASLLDCDYDYIEKERDTETGKVRAVSTLSGNVSGKDVVIYDDMISTGGTIELAARAAASGGAGKIVAAAPHLIMAGNAYQRITDAGVSELYGTRTVPFTNAHMVDISKEIADTVRNVLGPSS